MHTAEEPQEAGEDQVDLVLLETANRALNDLWIDPYLTKKKVGGYHWGIIICMIIYIYVYIIYYTYNIYTCPT